MKSNRVYAHYDFAMLLPLLSTATRKVGAVYVVFLASTTAATSLEGIVWGAANGSFYEGICQAPLSPDVQWLRILSSLCIGHDVVIHNQLQVLAFH